MSKVREAYFIRKTGPNDKTGKVYIFYSNRTYSVVEDVDFKNFKKYFNEVASKETKGRALDGTREDVRSAIGQSILNRKCVDLVDGDILLGESNDLSNNNIGRTAIAKGTTLDDLNKTRSSANNAEKKELNDDVDLTKEKNNDGWKYALGGAAAVAALGGAAYILKNDKDDKKDSMEGKDWKYYLENAKESDQKTVMTKIYNILERLNVSQSWMRANDGTSKWGLTPEQALSMYTYFNNLSTEELAQIYNGETVNVDNIMEQANQGMIAMSFFYANDTIGDTTIAELFNDQASKNIISDFTQIQARYNRATNDKERTEIAKIKKQMYYDYFINNSSSKYVDVSSVPGASFVINTMYPVDFVRYFRSSADLSDFSEILVTGRVREDGTIEHRSKVDSACATLKADLEKYNEDIRELKNEYNAKKNSGFMKFSGETEYERLTKDVYDPQVILDMMSFNLKNIDKYPANVNTFNSTIDGERRLIPVGGSYSSSTGSSSYTRPSGNGGGQVPQKPPVAAVEEYTGNTPEEAAKKAIDAGAPKDMVDKATETIIKENEKAKEEAEEKADDLHNFYQDYYDGVFNGDMDKDEAKDNLKQDLKDGNITKDEYDKAIGVIKDADKDREDYEDGMDKDGTTVGGEVTNNGSEVNDDGSIDVDLNGDGQKEHIPSHNPNDPDNPYNMPDYADGAFDVDKNNSDDEIVYDDPNAPKQNNSSNQTTSDGYYDTEINFPPVTSDRIDGVVLDVDGNVVNPSEDKKPIEQNPVSDEELGDMTFSDGATSVGTSGGEVTEFDEDQLVNQVKSSQQNQETEIDGSIVSETEDSVEVASFSSFAQQFYDEEVAKEEAQVEQQEMESEPVKSLK